MIALMAAAQSAHCSAMLHAGRVTTKYLAPALTAGVPYERVPRAVQGVSARSANRHDRGQHGGIEPLGRQPREEVTVDRHGSHLGVITAEVNGIGTDEGFKA